MWDSSLRVIKGEHHVTPYPVASAKHMCRQIFFQAKPNCLEKAEKVLQTKKIGRHFLVHALYSKFETGF